MGLTHRHERKRKQQELSNIIEEFKAQQAKTVEIVEALHLERLSAIKIITDVEIFVNSLKNTPDNFKNEMKAIMLKMKNIEDKMATINKHLKSFRSDSQKTARTGVLAGVGIGLLSNPIGWSIAGLGIIGSVLISAKGNRTYIREANTKISEIRINLIEFQRLFVIVNQLKNETCRLRESTENLLESVKAQDMDKMLKRIKESNEILLTDKNLLNAFGKLINLTNALSVLIVKDVEAPNEQ